MGREVILVAFLVLCLSSLECTAWLFGRGGIRLADSRNCFCKAVDNNNYGRVLRDFGSIQSCRAFPTCSCRRAEMMTCSSKCERKVQEWVCIRNCDGKNNGLTIRSSFQASTCHSNRGDDIYICGKKTNCGHKK